MSLRNELIPQQLGNNTPNTAIGFGATGFPTLHGVFLGATVGLDGGIGLVPKPLIADRLKFLRGDGTWQVAGSGGLGNITGEGVDTRIPIWSSTSNITHSPNLSWDNINNIVKTQGFNISRGSTLADTTNGNFYYDTTTHDFIGRINGNWLSFTKVEEVTLLPTDTTLTLNESHRGKIIRTSATSTVTVVLSNLSARFSCTIVKGASGDVTFSGATTFSTIGGASTISGLNGAATIYHVGSNVWRGYGALGTAGSGTISSIGLTMPSTFTVSPSTLTSNGNFTVAFAVQAPETVLIGPVIGSAAAVPTFRALSVDSLPLVSFVDHATTGNFTLNLTTHRARTIDVSGTGAHQITLPNTGIPDGWWCNIWRGTNSGVISFISSLSIESDGSALNTAKSMATAVYKASGNKWILVGKLS